MLSVPKGIYFFSASLIFLVHKVSTLTKSNSDYNLNNRSQETLSLFSEDIQRKIEVLLLSPSRLAFSFSSGIVALQTALLTLYI